MKQRVGVQTLAVKAGETAAASLVVEEEQYRLIEVNPSSKERIKLLRTECL